MEKRFHVNPATGNAKECNARIKDCPFIHGETKENAMSAYETSMSERETSNTISRPDKSTKRPIDVLRVTPLKSMDASQLTQLLVDFSERNNLEIDKFESAIALASTLHAGQFRGKRGSMPKTPYIEHPLRNAVRLSRLGVKDTPTLISAVLHDVVEDGSGNYVKKYHDLKIKNELISRAILSEHIELEYGQRTREIVEYVTNDYVEESLSTNRSLEEKTRIYRDHVKESIKDRPDVMLVKISDFIDNASGLHHTDTPERREKTIKQAKKYIPVVEVFQKEIKRQQNSGDLIEFIDDNSVNILKNHMGNTTNRLHLILKKYDESPLTIDN